MGCWSKSATYSMGLRLGFLTAHIVVCVLLLLDHAYCMNDLDYLEKLCPIFVSRLHFLNTTPSRMACVARSYLIAWVTKRINNLFGN